MYTEKRLLSEIDKIVWDPHTSDIEKTHAVQGLLYQWGACQDHMTEQMFGDDDAHVSNPNMRRI
jgi:hypothetical protein